MANKIKNRETSELVNKIRSDKNHKNSAWYKEIERELNKRGVSY